MNQISLVIGSKRYTIRLQEPYAKEMEKKLCEIFDTAKDNDVKRLLQAYLSKQLECIEMEDKLSKLVQKLSD